MNRSDLDLAWQDRAACLGIDPNLFFPERGDIATLNQAKRVCDSCPVRYECLEYGLGEKHGVWGGTSERERRHLRRQRRHTAHRAAS